jgi:hypothetical protein
VAENKIQEIAQEFRTVVAGRANLLDSILPPVAFVILNALLGLGFGLGGALAIAGLLAAARLLRRESTLYALGGVGGVVLAAAIAWLLGREEGFFLPGIITNALTVLLTLISLLARRPLVAWTSYLARRWPLAWYWHQQVRPAYAEVTWAWLLFFAARLALQVALYQREAAGLLGALQVASGWPLTVVLLAGSYLYGTWRLRNLGGPSVAEFEAGAEPPWQGQQRGF